MRITKLNQTHTSKCASLFSNPVVHDMFSNIYLADLNNFHAYGLFNESDDISSIVSFYEAIDEPAWYCTKSTSSAELMNSVIQLNEQTGRLKFYMIANANVVSDRYDFVDEFIVPAKTKCCYTSAWELLFTRELSSVDSVVRCYYLKQEHRIVLPIGGNI